MYNKLYAEENERNIVCTIYVAATTPTFFHTSSKSLFGSNGTELLRLKSKWVPGLFIHQSTCLSSHLNVMRAS